MSRQDLDHAVAAKAAADGQVAAARAALNTAQLNLGYTKVESPASGVVSRSQRSEGTLISGPDVLLTTVMQVDPIWVNFGIPDNEAARLQKEVARVVQTDEVKGRFAQMGLQPEGGSAEELGARVAKDIAKWTAVAKAANIKND